MATALENNGATVYIIGRRLAVLKKAAQENNVRHIRRIITCVSNFVCQKYNNILPLQGDITDRDSLLSVVETIRKDHGYIDLIVNNAGIAKNLYSHPLPSPKQAPSTSSAGLPSPPGTPQGTAPIPSIKNFQSSLWETGSPDDFAQVFATNVTAPYYTTVAFLDLLHQGNVRQQMEASPEADPLSFSRPPYHSSQVLTVSSSGGFRLDAKVLYVYAAIILIRLAKRRLQVHVLYVVKKRVYPSGQGYGQPACPLGYT